MSTWLSESLTPDYMQDWVSFSYENIRFTHTHWSMFF